MKPTTRTTPPDPRAHWAEIIRKCETSGLSVREYCKNNGIREPSYYTWRRKLRKDEVANSSEIDLVPSGFTEVRLEELSLSPTIETADPKQGCVTAPNVIIIEASGIIVTAGSEYPSDKLNAVLRELVQA